MKRGALTAGVAECAGSAGKPVRACDRFGGCAPCTGKRVSWIGSAMKNGVVGGAYLITSETLVCGVRKKTTSHIRIRSIYSTRHMSTSPPFDTMIDKYFSVVSTEGIAAGIRSEYPLSVSMFKIGNPLTALAR